MKTESNSKTNPMELNGLYRELAEEFGVELAEDFYYKYSGLQVTFPLKFFSIEYRYEQIINEFNNGASAKSLAKKYEYSERQIRRIIKSQNG